MSYHTTHRHVDASRDVSAGLFWKRWRGSVMFDCAQGTYTDTITSSTSVSSPVWVMFSHLLYYEIYFAVQLNVRLFHFFVVLFMFWMHFVSYIISCCCVPTTYLSCSCIRHNMSSWEMVDKWTWQFIQFVSFVSMLAAYYVSFRLRFPTNANLHHSILIELTPTGRGIRKQATNRQDHEHNPVIQSFIS